MGSGDQILTPDAPFDSNNNDSVKYPLFKISPPSSQADSEPYQQLSPPLTPHATVPTLGQPQENAQSLLEPCDQTFERFRSRSEGSMLRKPRKGCLLNRNGDLKHKLPRHVSFADSTGNALAQVLFFDENPRSICDFVDSDDDHLDDCLDMALNRFRSNNAQSRPKSDRRFVPYFTLAYSGIQGQKLLHSTLDDRQICLESISVTSPWRVTGTVLVKNLCFHKRVFARQSLDMWRSYKDIQAEFVSTISPDVDRFKFDLRFAFKISAGTRLELAFGFERGDTGVQHWDSNGEVNYGFWYKDSI